MKTKYISDLQAGDEVEDIFFVRSGKVLNFKSKPGSYLNLILSDRTGVIQAKFWDYNPGIDAVPG